jgi:hypothetical protein
VFLLSPANCSGVRAQMVMSPNAQFALARQLRSEEGASIGDLFSFVSGLYFRGKLAYARRFARPSDPTDPVTAGGVLVITPNAGLRSADTPIGFAQFTSFASASVDLRNPAYRRPLEQGARALQDAVGSECDVVLLGSIASGKYVEVLQPIFGDKLVFPPAFVGRGDMSRGGLMLRCVMAGVELEYVPISGAVRHGQRPPKLEPIKGILGHGEPEVRKPLSHGDHEGRQPLSHREHEGQRPLRHGEHEGQRPPLRHGEHEEQTPSGHEENQARPRRSNSQRSKPR